MIRARTAGIRAPSVGRAGRYLLLYAFVFPFAISARSGRSLDGELVADGRIRLVGTVSAGVKQIGCRFNLLSPKLFDLL